MTTTLDSLLARADLLGAECTRIASEIERYAREVEDARRAPQDYAQQLKDLNGNIDMAEITIRAEVDTETTDALTAALKYKNDSQRKSETARRIQQDPDLISLNREKRIVERQKADADQKLAGASDLLKAYFHVVALKNSEAMLIASTICALAPDAPAPATIEALEKAIVERLSVSIRSGKMKQIIQTAVTELIREHTREFDLRGPAR
jgi:hypothetical protein